MRIISGTRRSKKLFAPKNDRIRPTSDRAREALFNILESMLPAPLSEYDFLDVFAGTGAIGLEAASRGARSVTFIDIDLELVKRMPPPVACRNFPIYRKTSAACRPPPDSLTLFLWTRRTIWNCRFLPSPNFLKRAGSRTMP